MTPVGHSITGAAPAVLALRLPVRKKAALLTLGTFVALANLPDWPLPGRGHERYQFSHSIFVTLPLVIVGGTLALTLSPLRKSRDGSRVIIAAGLACISHLLLDTFYNHGLGLAMFRPLSSESPALPIPRFEILDTRQSPFAVHNLKVFLIEFVWCAPLFLLVILYRKRTTRARDLLTPSPTI